MCKIIRYIARGIILSVGHVAENFFVLCEFVFDRLEAMQ